MPFQASAPARSVETFIEESHGTTGESIRQYGDAAPGLEHGPGECDAPTIQETDLQAAVMKAINKVVGQKKHGH